MTGSRHRLLPMLLLALLALGALLRPMLVLACEIHATTHAHAVDPHDHSHDAVEGGGDAAADASHEGADEGHGSHEGQLLGSLAGAAAGNIRLELVAPGFGPDPLPPMRGTTPPTRERSAPFRPPIA